MDDDDDDDNDVWFSRSKSRLEEINEIIARSQVRAQHLLNTGSALFTSSLAIDQSKSSVLSHMNMVPSSRLAQQQAGDVQQQLLKLVPDKTENALGPEEDEEDFCETNDAD